MNKNKSAYKNKPIYKIMLLGLVSISGISHAVITSQSEMDKTKGVINVTNGDAAIRMSGQTIIYDKPLNIT